MLQNLNSNAGTHSELLRGDNVLRHFWIPDDEHISSAVRPVGKDQSREILLISALLADNEAE